MSPETKNKQKRRISRFRLPKGVVTKPEVVSSPSENQLVSVIDRFERGFTKMGFKSRAERQWGDCNIAPDIFSFVANDESKRQGFTADARQYQLLDLHEAAGGPKNKAFQHGFNTISIGGEAFLVDLTFAQFQGDNGYLSAVNEQYSSGVENNNHLATELVDKGYAPLTDTNLQEYLRITSLSSDKQYCTDMTAQLLQTIQTRPVELAPSDGVTPSFGM